MSTAVEHDDETLILVEVNGVARSFTVNTSETLSEFLRRELQLYACRETCGIGICGTCTVLVDDRQVSACITLVVAIDGCRIETAEGLGRVEPSAVQEAFIANQAFQCSFCTPGFVMAVEAWRRSGADPDDLREHLTGHLCRCGCYSQIIAAADDVGAQCRGQCGVPMSADETPLPRA